MNHTFVETRSLLQSKCWTHCFNVTCRPTHGAHVQIDVFLHWNPARDQVLFLSEQHLLAGMCCLMLMKHISPNAKQPMAGY